MFSSKLAIVIPAYKSTYFEQTLQSFANQTNKNFIVYVGNDNSTDEIHSVVLKYTSTINIVYHKFKENFGQRSLTKHWQRCIELCNEDWIWLFSDDDIAEPDCVDQFFKFLDTDSEFYKFQTKIINSKGDFIYKKYDKVNKFTKYIDTKEFIHKRLECSGYRSFAVEYVFSRRVYEKFKFVEFPLAWASDDATWIKFSLYNGKIKCIPAFVYWRYSSINISSLNTNIIINKEKIKATVLYCNWIKKITHEENISLRDAKIFNWFTIQFASLNYPLSYNLFNFYIQKAHLKINFFLRITNYYKIKYFHFKNFILKKYFFQPVKKLFLFLFI